MKSKVKQGSSMKTVKSMMSPGPGCSADAMSTKSKGPGPHGNQSGGGKKRRKGGY